MECDKFVNGLLNNKTYTKSELTHKPDEISF